MELRFVEPTSTDTNEIFTPSYGPEALKLRRPVWQALSELWLTDTLTDFDYNYIAIRLADSSFKEFELESILNHEVCPAMKNTAMQGQLATGQIDPRSLENLILLHLENSPSTAPQISGWKKFKNSVAGLFKKRSKADTDVPQNKAQKAVAFEEVAARWLDVLDRIQAQRRQKSNAELHSSPSPQAISFDTNDIRRHAEDIM